MFKLFVQIHHFDQQKPLGLKMTSASCIASELILDSQPFFAEISLMWPHLNIISVSATDSQTKDVQILVMNRSEWFLFWFEWIH